MALNLSAVGTILDGLLRMGEETKKDAYLSTALPPEWIEVISQVKKGQANAFERGIIYPLSCYLEGLINAEISIKPEVEFLLLKHTFLDAHLTALFEKIEGFSCCGDKASWAIHALLGFFLLDTPVVLDYSMKYTYHLPKKILNTQEQLLDFFNALVSLYYGRPQAYLEQLTKLTPMAKPRPEG